MNESDVKDGFKEWCVVELFGHNKIAGVVTEASIGGCSFLRVDVPAVHDRPAYTKYFGNGAVYAMTPTSQEVVEQLLAAAYYTSDPIPYIPAALPTAKRDVDFDDEDFQE